MSTPLLREVEHEITVRAPAADVYRMLAEVENWPRLFPPSVYVDYLERNGNSERIRIWATANGEAKNWTSRRVLEPEALTIRFWQEVSAPPVAEMYGTWLVEPAGGEQTRLRLLHRYRAIDDDPEQLAWIDRAVDTNSRKELPALKATVEQASQAAELTMSFSDTVRINGSGKDVYDFVNEANLWAHRVPHVAQVWLAETTPGVQTLRMDTLTKDGTTHTTESVRVCFPHHKIAYKQTTLPALMTLHTGYWLFEEDPRDANAVLATAQHTVVINEANIASVLGPNADVAQAREYVRGALSANSTATLGYAKQYAESRRPESPSTKGVS
jgi:ribosome-associated toxin RatA of RatAB toxin-antitoxin module